MTRSKFLAILAFTAAAILPDAGAATVTVFAAASLSDSLKEISTAYEKNSGDSIVLNLGASSLLARQIEEGAPADVFFSADEAKMDELEQKGLILKETRVSRLSNSLVIVVAENGAALSSPEDLATARVKRIALAQPNTVPAGIYARKYLERMNLWAAVRNKVVPTENVRAALSAVEAGNVEAGIVYKTDAAISKRVRVACKLPATGGPPISYPVAVVTETRQPGAAKRFVAYLDSNQAAAVFKKFGFIIQN